jgi:hypothetical protein
MYTLFHNLNPMAMLYPQDYERCWFTNRDQHFTRVAEIDASLERIFAVSNHIDTDWTKNAEVIWSASDALRSTSVGDVIVCVQSNATSFSSIQSRPRIARVRLVPLNYYQERAWMVMAHGLKELQEESR